MSDYKKFKLTPEIKGFVISILSRLSDRDIAIEHCERCINIFCEEYPDHVEKLFDSTSSTDDDEKKFILTSVIISILRAFAKKATRDFDDATSDIEPTFPEKLLKNQNSEKQVLDNLLGELGISLN